MKQVIVMRTDLNMRKGKMIAQGAHATMGALLPYLGGSPADYVERRKKVTRWLCENYPKICVGVDSLEGLDAVRRAAIDADLIAYRVVDSGRTEFRGVSTPTCCAIGPDDDDAIDAITGELSLL